MSLEKYAGYHFATKNGINSESHTGTHNGASIDRQGYDHMLALLQVGTMTGSAVDATLQDSANGTSGWANYTPDVVYGNNKASTTTATFPQATTMGSSKLDIDLSAAKRYVRWTTTTTGGAVTYSIACLLNLRNGEVPGSTA